MPTPPLSDEVLQEAVDALHTHGRKYLAANALGIDRRTFHSRLAVAARRGLLLDEPPAMPGFEITKVTTAPDGSQHVTQKQEHGERYEPPPTHVLGKITAHVDAEGRIVQSWPRYMPDAEQQEAAMRAVVAALKEEVPRAEPVAAPLRPGDTELLNQFTVTDLHFGMLAWPEENARKEAWDLKEAERTLLNWFTAAIELSPPAATAILAQLGDLLHHDSHLSVTPTHAHVLDADSRLQKMIRVVIRCLRQIVARLLAKHERVHIVMADANHDPAGGAWLREMFAAFFEDEPRVTVDSSASTYYCYEHGETSLFYHHGHKRKIADVDSVFAGQFRDVFGRTKHSYAHIGHLHSDELKSTNLMKVERHETLSAPDAYAANGGWLAGRSAKVITYHKKFGEVSRVVISPQMLAVAA
ncbi:MAG: oxidoreductase [Luteitalea sp.]|nr:oxidoreductase [Luteitalea sp.]